MATARIGGGIYYTFRHDDYHIWERHRSLGTLAGAGGQGRTLWLRDIVLGAPLVGDGVDACGCWGAKRMVERHGPVGERRGCGQDIRLWAGDRTGMTLSVRGILNGLLFFDI